MTKNIIVSLYEAWGQWKDCLDSEDINSIFQQIHRMIWDAALFQLIMEDRKRVIEENPDEPKLNIHLLRFTNRCFFQSQAATIRRLIDTSSYGIRGEKGIYSLYSLISDMESRRLEFTRAKYFTLRNLQYDYSSMIEAEKEYALKHSKKGEAVWIPAKYDWAVAEDAHKIFDRLSNRNGKARAETDLIDEKVFIVVKDKLQTCQPIIDFANKYIAHSSTRESRGNGFSDIDSKINLDKLIKAHKIIYEIAEFLSNFLFSVSHIALIIKPIDLLKNWNIPIASKDDLNNLDIEFDKYHEETEKWRLEGMDDLWHEIEL